MTVAFHDTNSLFGFFILLVVTSQLLSGVLLSFSLIPEPMVIPMIRDEEDIEDLYTDDYFWIHERVVDLIFIFSYMHMFRKLYICAYDVDQEVA
jgi:quinol-cytochrome oxidoreductase complex cytochrome b subunit